MNDDQTKTPRSAEWDFPTLADVWDASSRAIVAGGEKLDALAGADREASLLALCERVANLAIGLDDGWLVMTAAFMVDDLYKSYYHQFVPSDGARDYITATAGMVLEALHRRGFALHYVVDSTHPEAELAVKLTLIPAIFDAAGFVVTGPQLMALDLMQQRDGRPLDIAAVYDYRTEGHALADEVIVRCHQEHQSSAYLNLDFDDDAPALATDVALSAGGTAGNIVVFRERPPFISAVKVSGPPGVDLPDLGGPDDDS